MRRMPAAATLINTSSPYGYFTPARAQTQDFNHSLLQHN
jgi:hypothetical protein